MSIFCYYLTMKSNDDNQSLCFEIHKNFEYIKLLNVYIKYNLLSDNDKIGKIIETETETWDPVIIKEIKLTFSEFIFEYNNIIYTYKFGDYITRLSELSDIFLEEFSPKIENINLFQWNIPSNDREIYIQGSINTYCSFSEKILNNELIKKIKLNNQLYYIYIVYSNNKNISLLK